MRQNWQLPTISEVCEVVNGGTPKTGVPAYWGGSHMWITPAEMGNRRDPYVGETDRRLTDAGLPSANLLPPFSVILSSRAPIGHLVINTVPMATNQGCKGLIPKDVIDHKYLYYYIGSIVGLLNDLGIGATFKELSGTKLKEVRVPLPPMSEQIGIVALLDETFARITSAGAHAEKNLKSARELFDCYLNLLVNGEGKDWVEKKLAEICEVKDGTHDSPKYVESGIPFVTQKNITRTGLSLSKVNFISERDHQNYYRRSNASFGDILISMIGANRGMACSVDDPRVFSIKNVGLIKSGKEIDQAYLLYFLKSSLADKYIRFASKGGAQEFIGLTRLREFPIAVPPRREQQCIVEKLDDLSKRTHALQGIYQRKLGELQALKQSILQKAFSGQLTTTPSIKEAAE